MTKVNFVIIHKSLLIKIYRYSFLVMTLMPVIFFCGINVNLNTVKNITISVAAINRLFIAMP